MRRQFHQGDRILKAIFVVGVIKVIGWILYDRYGWSFLR
jgi:hypothetical protein